MSNFRARDCGSEGEDGGETCVFDDEALPSLRFPFSPSMRRYYGWVKTHKRARTMSDRCSNESDCLFKSDDWLISNQGSEANEPLKTRDARKSLLSYATRLRRLSSPTDFMYSLDIVLDIVIVIR